ncbi:MAG TPA: AEC family transporter [archaeon]|nr:AEC family transporter [archaeon]
MLFDPILIAFFGIALGFVFQKKIGFDQKSVADLLIYVVGPALVFSAIYSKHIELSELAILGGASVFIIVACGIVAAIVFRLLNYKNNGMLLPAMFMNSGYLGYPVALFAFGEIGLQKAIIFDAVETILSFTLGVFLVQDDKLHWKEKAAEIFRIPLVYAIVLGVTLNLTSVQVPAILIDALTLVGSATIPLALLVLGGRLATLKIGSLKVPVAVLLVRFCVGAAAAIGFIKFFNVQGVVASVILLIAVMPPAVNSYVLNEKFGKDPENAATAVLIGTLLCALPIAIVLSMI